MPSLKKAVITGPTGVIGWALIKELLSNGVQVTAVVRPGSPRNADLPTDSSLSVVECDLNDYPSLPQKIAGPQEAFFHLAWAGTFGAARNHLALQEQNIRAALSAVDAAAAMGCSVFVGVGSQSEFGHVEGVLCPDLPCFPDNGYGAAKLSAGHLTRVSCQIKGVRQAWCRVLSTFGPHDGEHTLVMSTLLKMMAGEPTPFTKGEQVWDYLYCADVARALVAVAEKGRDGAVYCLGSGKPRLLKEYITAIRDAINPSHPLVFGELPYYENQVMHLEADITNLTEDTGFVPQYTFEAGLAETLAFLQKGE